MLHGYLYLRCETDGMKISPRNVATLENREEKAGPEGIIWTLREQKDHKGLRGGNRNLQQGKPPPLEAQAPQLERSPHALQLEEACMQQQRPRAVKNIKKKGGAVNIRLKPLSSILLNHKSL